MYYIYMYVCIYIYINRDRETETETEPHGPFLLFIDLQDLAGVRDPEEEALPGAGRFGNKLPPTIIRW